MNLCKLRLCFDYHGSVHAGSLRSRRFPVCQAGPLLAFRQGTDYIIHPFRGESTSPCQKLARVLPSGIVDEPSSRWRSVEREARLLIAMLSLDSLGVPAIHFLVQCSLRCKAADVRQTLFAGSKTPSTTSDGARQVSVISSVSVSIPTLGPMSGKGSPRHHWTTSTLPLKCTMSATTVHNFLIFYSSLDKKETPFLVSPMLLLVLFCFFCDVCHGSCLSQFLCS